MNQSKVQDAAALLVMKKAMNMARQNGSEVVEMIKGSVPNADMAGTTGSNLDVYV